MSAEPMTLRGKVNKNRLLVGLKKVVDGLSVQGLDCLSSRNSAPIARECKPMNAPYYNAEPGSRRMVDLMFYECENAREDFENDTDEYLNRLEAETDDDIDDAYDRERENDYEGEEDFD